MWGGRYKERPNGTLRDERHSIWNGKYTRWNYNRHDATELKSVNLRKHKSDSKLSVEEND